MSSVLYVFLSVCVFHLTVADLEPYMVPPALIEVFRPRGFRISIPDYPGIRLFAVHIVVNKDLHGLEAGDISRDILKKNGDRWVYEDKKLKLNLGDVINYWTFVIKEHLGYRRDDQTYTVRNIQEAPPDFYNGKGPYYTTTEVPPKAEGAHAPYIPLITLAPCVCLTTEQHPEAAPPAPPPASAPSDIAIWRELLVNMSKENAQYRQEVATLYGNNQLLVSKLEKLGDQNIKRLKLEGKVLKDDDPLMVIKTILTENLRIINTSIVTDAVRNDDGTITFEMRTVDDKLMVLREARDKLKGARFRIKDIDALSFVDKDGKVIIDVRSQ